MEVTGDSWRKSSYSGGNGGECVEVASANRVLVRDTTDRERVILSFGAPAWLKFLSTVR